MRPDAIHPDSRPAGFTLVELLVVIALIVVLLTIIVPATDALFESGTVQQSVNTVSAGLSTARTQVARKPPFRPTSEGYSGTAVVVTPAGELRFTRNADGVLDSDDRPLEQPQTSSPARVAVNGYTDVGNADYLSMPDGGGLVGITRTPNVDGLKLLAPPFAIRFTQDGQLTVGGSAATALTKERAKRLVFYDGDYDGKYQVFDSTRANPRGGGEYVPGRWDPSSSRYAGDYIPDDDRSSPDPFKPPASDTANPNAGKRKLPFERLEAVVGVVVFDKAALREAGHRLYGVMATDSDGQWPDTDSGAAGQWIMKNGTPLFFGRYTGEVIKQP